MVQSSCTIFHSHQQHTSSSSSPLFCHRYIFDETASTAPDMKFMPHYDSNLDSPHAGDAEQLSWHLLPIVHSAISSDSLAQFFIHGEQSIVVAYVCIVG